MARVALGVMLPSGTLAPGEATTRHGRTPLLSFVTGPSGMGMTRHVRRELTRWSSPQYLTFTEFQNAILRFLRDIRPTRLTALVARPDILILDDFPFHEPLQKITTWEVIRHLLVKHRVRKGRPTLLVMDPYFPLVQPLIRSARCRDRNDGVRILRFEPPPYRKRVRWAFKESVRLGHRPVVTDIVQAVQFSPWSYGSAKGVLLSRMFRGAQG